jgi:hypothetical protein
MKLFAIVLVLAVSSPPATPHQRLAEAFRSSAECTTLERISATTCRYEYKGLAFARTVSMDGSGEASTVVAKMTSESILVFVADSAGPRCLEVVDPTPGGGIFYFSDRDGKFHAPDNPLKVPAACRP